VGYQGGLHGGISYKIVQDTGRLCGGGCTKEAKDSYNYFWLFDINDIINAEEPHKIRPFSYGKWSHPYDKDGAHKIIGGTFDAENSRLFLTLKGAGRTGRYDRPPLIISYKIEAKQKASGDTTYDRSWLHGSSLSISTSPWLMCVSTFVT
jgi:hypothetical protein